MTILNVYRTYWNRTNSERQMDSPQAQEHYVAGRVLEGYSSRQEARMVVATSGVDPLFGCTAEGFQYTKGDLSWALVVTM